MHLFEQASLLKIFIDESDKHEGNPLYETIIQKALELKLKGATVTRGIAGFGSQSLIHTSKILDLSTNLPVIIEIIDQREKLIVLLPFINDVVKEGLVTIEDIQIIKYRK